MPMTTVCAKPACVQCTATYKALDKSHLEYDIVDISVDSATRDYVMSLGYLFFRLFKSVSSARAPGAARRSGSSIGHKRQRVGNAN